MVRKQNWPLLLSRFLRERRGTPFEWGRNDCLLFVADAVLLLTGTDPAASQRGTYHDAAGAEAIMAGAGGMVRFVTAQMGVEPHQNYRLAKRGDVVAMELEAGLTAGFVDDTGTQIAAMTELRVVRLPLKLATFVWSY